MNPTKILSEEHQNILKIIEALIKESGALGAGKEIDKTFFEKAIDFIRNYADKFHHAKEEDILFKEFNKAEGAHCNPVEQMLYEHDLGRNFVKGLEQGLKENNRDKIIENSQGYANLLKEHIFKEDNILYPMIDEVLKQETQELILNQFEEAELEKFSQGTKEKYLAMAEELRL